MYLFALDCYNSLDRAVRKPVNVGGKMEQWLSLSAIAVRYISLHCCELDALMVVEGGSRLMPSSNRNRVVGCMEEFVGYTISMLLQFLLVNQHSKLHERRLRKRKLALSAWPRKRLKEIRLGAV